MTSRAEELLAEALTLPERERAEMVARLIESLDDEPDEGAEEAWKDEIARRMAELKSGEAELVSWSQVREEMLRERSSRADA